MMKDMLNTKIHPPHTRALAERLVTDIHRRGLAVGDRYLTIEAASRMLGVRRAVAGKAIRHLAEQEILVSKQRTGTIVGPGLKKMNRSKVRTVSVLLPGGDAQCAHWSYQPFVTGIRAEYPEVNVQFTFIPESDPLAYVRELIDGARSLGQFAGVIAVSCPPEVYSFLAKLGVPAVVYGSLYSSELPIASVDVDGYESGRLLTQYLVGRGHHRIALVMSGGGRPGNNLFFDGISAVLTAAGLPHNTLIQRLVRNDTASMQEVAKELMERSDHPTAIITRGSMYADVMASVASDIGLMVPDDLEIVFDHEDQTTFHLTTAGSFPRVLPKLSFAEIAATIGKTLKEMSEGIPSRPTRLLIPVEFCEPEQVPKRMAVVPPEECSDEKRTD